MRLLIPFLLFISFQSEAQIDSSLQYSKLEQMVMRPGRFIKLETDTIGQTNSLHIGMVTAEDLQSGEKQRSVCFVANTAFSSIAFSYNNLQVDIAELDDLIKSLTRMKDIIAAKNTGELQVYQYTASNLLVLTMDNRINRHNRWDITLTRRYKYLTGSVPGSYLLIKDKEIGQVVNLLEWYKQSLKGDLYR